MTDQEHDNKVLQLRLAVEIQKREALEKHLNEVLEQLHESAKKEEAAERAIEEIVGIQLDHSDPSSPLSPTSALKSWSDSVIQRAEAAERSLKLQISDSTDDDLKIRELARPHLTQFQIDGDTYGVPTVVDIFESLLKAKGAAEKACASIGEFVDEVSAAIQHPTASADDRLSKIKTAGKKYLSAWPNINCGSNYIRKEQEHESIIQSKNYKEGISNTSNKDSSPDSARANRPSFEVVESAAKEIYEAVYTLKWDDVQPQYLRDFWKAIARVLINGYIRKDGPEVTQKGHRADCENVMKTIEESFESLESGYAGTLRLISLDELKSIVAEQLCLRDSACILGGDCPNEKELEQERQKREAAEKACAEMRALLYNCPPCPNFGPQRKFGPTGPQEHPVEISTTIPMEQFLKENLGSPCGCCPACDFRKAAERLLASTDCGSSYIRKDGPEVMALVEELLKTEWGDKHTYDQKMHCFSCGLPKTQEGHHPKCTLLHALEQFRNLKK